METLVAPDDRLVGEDPVIGWKRITGSTTPVLGYERLKKSKRTRVYRIDLAGEPRSIIAKRCREKVALLEREMYTAVLDGGSLRAPAFYGFGVDPITEDEYTYHWVFMEDLGPRRHDPSNADERRRLAQWLGGLGLLTAGASSLQYPNIDDRRLPYYRQFLVEAGRDLPKMAGARSWPASVRSLIETMRRSVDRVDSRWPWIESVASAAPPVVAHGDCLPKNIHVTREEAVIPIDWGGAGIGLAGADLGVSTVWFDRACELAPHVEAYVEAIRPVWKDADAVTVRRLACIGRTMWAIKLIVQSIPSMEGGSTAKAESHLGLYGALLERSAEAIEQS